MVLLHHHLKALRLPTIGAECEKVAAQAASRQRRPPDLPAAAAASWSSSNATKRAAERRLKAARFPTIKSLETFDFTARPSVNKMLVAELARCEFIDKRENVLLVGQPGHRQVPPRHRARRRRRVPRATRCGSSGPPSWSPR